MGRKRWVDYGLYRTHIFFSPAFAQKTKFTYRDLDNFLFALQNMFRDDSSSARPGGLRVVGLIDFQHSTALGNAPAHKLFDLVKVERKLQSDTDEREFPESLKDYHGASPKGEVTLNGSSQTNNGSVSNNNAVTARRIVWDIPLKTEEPSATSGTSTNQT